MIPFWDLDQRRIFPHGRDLTLPLFCYGNTCFRTAYRKQFPFPFFPFPCLGLFIQRLFFCLRSCYIFVFPRPWQLFCFITKGTIPFFFSFGRYFVLALPICCWLLRKIHLFDGQKARKVRLRKINDKLTRPLALSWLKKTRWSGYKK